MRTVLGTEYIQYMNGQQIITNEGIHVIDASARLTFQTLTFMQ
ncbi:hypothetical protein QE197_22150 (plasmid) [Arsenophonus nasoniae]|nr:hypothetical protein [Arsenophonus nasoniae]WGM13278.1 hypothetical protein QE197_22150 [Arsenophonus nasoniae]